jgi:flagellar biogenesis protein FliO
MIRYPDRTPIIDILAPVFTLVKWVFVAGSFVLLLAAIGVGAWRLLKTRIGK